MSRLRQALKDLKQRGYAPSSLKQLSGGINSAVFQAKTDNAMKYALKLYPLPTNNDPRNRCRTEKYFLNYLKSCHVYNTPILIESNISAGWSLMSWIEGKKPTSLQTADLQNIVDFIGSINEASAEATRFRLQPASEACQSLPGLITSIAERLRKLQSTTPGSKASQEAMQWISHTIVFPLLLWELRIPLDQLRLASRLSHELRLLQLAPQVSHLCLLLHSWH